MNKTKPPLTDKRSLSHRATGPMEQRWKMRLKQLTGCIGAVSSSNLLLYLSCCIFYFFLCADSPAQPLGSADKPRSGALSSYLQPFPARQHGILEIASGRQAGSGQSRRDVAAPCLLPSPALCPFKRQNLVLPLFPSYNFSLVCIT